MDDDSRLEQIPGIVHHHLVRLIRDILEEKRSLGETPLSCEFFPAKTPDGEKLLLQNVIPKLLAINPAFFSVTYGAGGTTRDQTLEVVDLIQKEQEVPTMAHLTCVGSTRIDIGDFLKEASGRGISNILALRGDPPPGQDTFIKSEGGFEFSYELVEYIHSENRFGIGVAGFPEGHIACTEGREVDWDRLINKVECGADFIVTQLFFDNADFFAFRDYLRARGMTKPILAGVIPILSSGQIKKFTQLCGAKLTEEITTRLDELGDDNNAVSEFGVEYASRQCEELISNGVDGLHFYTLNKAKPTLEIVKNLGLQK